MKGFIATVKPDKIKNISAIANSLEKEGFVVKDILKIIGIITGHTEDSKQLSSFETNGISSIEEDREVSI